jgi:O-antigen/teichoic acid export membrane protein
MNTVQRIAKNSLVLLASNIISKILGFFYVMYIARYLGAEGFGILSFALAFTGIFSVFSDLGLGPLTVREVARDKSLAGKYLGNITVIKIFLVIITFGLIAITINLLGYPKQTIKVVYFLALSVILSSFSNIFNSIFQAYEKMEYQSIEQILSSILMLSGALFAISQGFSVVRLASIYFLVSAVILGYSFAVCAWKFSLPKLEVDWSFWKPTIKEALPFFLSAVVDIIAFKIDIIMLSMMKGDMVVGWYSAAYRLIEF